MEIFIESFKNETIIDGVKFLLIRNGNNFKGFSLECIYNDFYVDFFWTGFDDAVIRMTLTDLDNQRRVEYKYLTTENFMKEVDEKKLPNFKSKKQCKEIKTIIDTVYKLYENHYINLLTK